MADIPLEGLQRAVFERLHDDPALADVEVVDEVPDDLAAPYVVLWKQEHRSFDTKSARGWEAKVEVRIWSTYNGMKEVADLANKVIRAMSSAPYVVEGFTVLSFGFDAVEVERAENQGVPGRVGVVRQNLKLVP